MSYTPHQTDPINHERNHFPRELKTTTSRTLSSRSRASESITSRKRIEDEDEFSSEEQSYPIIVHSHLCWDWVWQRPQQFLSRLSRRHPVLFVETVGPDARLVVPHVQLLPTQENGRVTRVRLQFPAWRWGQADYVDRTRRRVLQEALVGPLAGQFDDAVQWFYDPMAVTAFAGHLGEIATVYDCMDELSKFSEAHPEVSHRERELLRHADVVFTGGRRLYDAKRQHNENCHFYGCGVDVEHFGRARAAGTELPPEAKDWRKPVLGYFGVVDERMDYELLAKLADANPSWTIAMIGPAIKIQEHALPRRANLHWLGGRPYSELPAYAKAFDVCLMPFARNEATEYINPTKALAYMATSRAIVSSDVPDVVSNFGEVVQIARGHDEFIEFCRRMVAAPDTGAIERGLRMAQENTWDSIVAKMEGHVNEVLARKRVSHTSS